ncbi:MAG: phosphatidylglycerol lysyltransferase domain-containing protein [Solirubrobacteraceae bacterium]
MSPWREPRAWRVPAGLATALAAVLTLASSLSPNAPARQRLLERVEPGSAQSAVHAAGVVGGLALLVVSLGVLRGRRRSAHAAVAVLCVLAIVHAAKGLDYEEALVALGLAVLLRVGLRAASRGAAPSRPAFAALVAVAAVAGAYALTLCVLLVSGRSPGVGEALAGAGRSLWAGARLTGLAPWLRGALHVAFGCALLAVAWALRAIMAPRRAQDGHDADAHRRAADIVARCGRDSIAPFVLRADKAFFFAHGAVLAYRTLRETAVVSGDPVGPPGSEGPIVRDFLAFAARRDWDVVLSGASGAHLDAYRALRLSVLQMGCEAVVDPAAFTRAGREGRTVRKAVHRVARRGWAVEVVPGGGLTAPLAAEIDAVESAWRAAHPRLYGFAMASDRLWGAPEDARDVYVLARAPGGAVRAFQRYVPFAGGLSLDAMRRLDDEPNGITDALVAAALGHARALGLRAVSLNFAGFAHVMAAETIGVRSRPLVRLGLRLVRGPFKLDRLVRFSQKFGPAWQPRFLVYTSRASLPLVALRVLQSEAYVRPPRPRLRADAWRPWPAPALGPADPSAAR